MGNEANTASTKAAQALKNAMTYYRLVDERIEVYRLCHRHRHRGQDSQRADWTASIEEQDDGEDGDDEKHDDERMQKPVPGTALRVPHQSAFPIKVQNMMAMDSFDKHTAYADRDQHGDGNEGISDQVEDDCDDYDFIVPADRAGD
ncbi:hypothetical protein PG985_002446 [Apiospora marii]